jgi:hypothetical protein
MRHPPPGPRDADQGGDPQIPQIPRVTLEPRRGQARKVGQVAERPRPVGDQEDDLQAMAVG